MSRQPHQNTKDLDIDCSCQYHGAGQICMNCRPDLCNPSTPAGAGLCGSASNPNSANLTPIAGPTDIYGRPLRTDSGRNVMSGAIGSLSPSAASTASSGQGPSEPRPIQQQPGRNEAMQYPSPGSPGYGTMGVGYAGLAQSPASYGNYGSYGSYGSKYQEFYDSIDANVQGAGAGAGAAGSSQQTYYQPDTQGGDKGKGKGKSSSKSSRSKGKGKEKRH